MLSLMNSQSHDIGNLSTMPKLCVPDEHAAVENTSCAPSAQWIQHGYVLSIIPYEGRASEALKCFLYFLVVFPAVDSTKLTQETTCDIAILYPLWSPFLCLYNWRRNLRNASVRYAVMLLAEVFYSECSVQRVLFCVHNFLSKGHLMWRYLSPIRYRWDRLDWNVYTPLALIWYVCLGAHESCCVVLLNIYSWV